MDGHLAVIQPERVTERDQLSRFFGSHDAGENSRLKNGAFFGVDLVVLQRVHNLVAEYDGGPRPRHALSNRFATNIHHGRVAGTVQMSKFLAHKQYLKFKVRRWKEADKWGGEEVLPYRIWV